MSAGSFPASRIATISSQLCFLYGLDRRWKRRLIRMAGLHRGARVLDLATGTGDLAFLASAEGQDRRWSRHYEAMLELAASKHAGKRWSALHTGRHDGVAVPRGIV